jgi:hypothetical protein
MDPYRTSMRGKHAQRATVPRGARELAIPFAIVWVACLADVVRVIARGTAFGSGATLTLALVVVLPWLLFRAP